MATTTNYGWTTPDDTALVKDGAAAIRTLGSSVDTTTKNLNPETTLGDLAYRSSTANVKTRLGLGTAGQVLQVNSGASAPEWATLVSGGMTAIATTTVDNTVATYTYSSLGSYKHIYIVGQGMTHNTTGLSTAQIRFNGDTGNNYRRVGLSGNTEGVFFSNGASQSAGWFGFRSLGTNTDTSGNRGSFVGWIPNYRGAGYKSTQSNGTTGTDIRIESAFTYWNNTDAITSITLLTESGANFKEGIITVYGVS